MRFVEYLLPFWRAAGATDWGVVGAAVWGVLWGVGRRVAGTRWYSLPRVGRGEQNLVTLLIFILWICQSRQFCFAVMRGAHFCEQNLVPVFIFISCLCQSRQFCFASLYSYLGLSRAIGVCGSLRKMGSQCGLEQRPYMAQVAS